MFIDEDRLRRDLEDYYGTAAFSGMPMAMMDLVKIKNASVEELIGLAEKLGFNLQKYLI